MRVFTSIYIILLVYIIAAIVFWGISLQKQNELLFEQQVIVLKSLVEPSRYPEAYNQQLEKLQHTRQQHVKQYIGEGGTFLVVILIGAVVVYTSFARRIRLSRQQNNFMLSVTHELKSPIAAMKLNLQTMERHQLNEDKRIQLLDRCITEANRLNDLCNNMLFASRLEGRQNTMARESFDLSDLVRYVAADYAGRYQGRFQAHVTPGCVITGDKIMLQMAISNVLENAVKYTPADTPVSVTLEAANGFATISIADSGSGIPDSEKKKIFNKFYRIGNEESRTAKGTGLGLYLTNKIILQHRGRIIVKNNTPSGAVFEITLPV